MLSKAKIPGQIIKVMNIHEIDFIFFNKYMYIFWYILIYYSKYMYVCILKIMSSLVNLQTMLLLYESQGLNASWYLTSLDHLACHLSINWPRFNIHLSLQLRLWLIQGRAFQSIRQSFCRHRRWITLNLSVLDNHDTYISIS